MKLLAKLAQITAGGMLSVALLSYGASMIWSAIQADPVIFNILLMLALIPLLLMLIGALSARAAYYACKSPHEAIAAAVVVSVISALGGIAIWLQSGTVVAPDFVSVVTGSMSSGNYIELLPVLIVYALAGAIGGVYDYYISRGRRCEIRPGQGM